MQTTFDVIVVGSGASRWLGGETAFRSRHQGGPARGEQAARRQGFLRARACLRPQVSRPGERLHSSHAAEAAGLLRLPRVELQVVRQRSRGISTNPDDKPFSWQGRTRVVGGRTNVWGRQCYRLSEQDLKGKSFDLVRRGLADQLHKSGADAYELVEDYVGISGQVENVPELPDSRFHPAMPMSCAETQLRTRVKSKLGWTVTIGRSANITKGINGRGPCHYCGPCEQGCVTPPTSTPRLRPSPTRSSPATPPSSPMPWSTRS